MPRAKVAISLEKQVLDRLDRLVKESVFPNRSRAIEAAVARQLTYLDRGRLARESAKLNPDFEKSLAEEGFAEELSEWPEY